MPKILESQSIWATHVRYLNDSSEFTLGWGKSWAKLLDLITLSDYEHKAQLKRIFEQFQRVILKAPGRTKYFVWCLTDDRATEVKQRASEGDRLSQWRAYSGAAQGFSLGFDTAQLEKCFKTSANVVYSLGRCLYDESGQDEGLEGLASRHFRDFLQKWKTYLKELRDPNLSDFENFKKNPDFTIGPIVEMYQEFLEFGAFMKHPGFVEENEWRFVFLSEHDGDCSFRESKFGLTPYLPIGLDLCASPSPLKRVVVGPGPHKEEWVETVKLLLAKKGVAGTEVVPSQIPYRG